MFYVGKIDYDYVGVVDGFVSFDDFEVMFFGDVSGFGIFVEVDDDFDVGVFEVEGVCVVLGIVVENGNGFVFEYVEIGVFVGVYFGGYGEKGVWDVCLGKKLRLRLCVFGVGNCKWRWCGEE